MGAAEGVVPRRLLVDLLEETAPPPAEHPGFKDIATVAQGTKDGIPTRLRLDATAWPSTELGVGGGTVAVAAPPAVVARWLADNTIPPGVHPPETVIEPGSPSTWNWRGGGITTTLSEETVLAE